MEDLTPVGLSGDGKRLILVGAQGQEYSVALDRRLRAALQGEQARLGQLEMTMESTLRPRDIQNRIRAGASAEEVAAAAQTTVERIMGFAGPVLAERAHIAQSAQASSVRRKNSEAGGAARTLGEAAAVRLRELGLHDDEVAWDAWRREDGRWALVADYVAEERPRRAEFTYDVRGRYVVADNEEARVLTGEARPRPAGKTAARPGQGRRLASVPNQPDQDELPLGDDAIELVSDHADADWMAPDDAAGAGAGQAAEHVEPETTGADEEPTVEVRREQVRPGAGDEPESPESAQEAEPADDADDTDEADATDEADEVDEAARAEEPEPRARPAKRKGRAPVPSWDEIMFGGGGRQE